MRACMQAARMQRVCMHAGDHLGPQTPCTHRDDPTSVVQSAITARAPAVQQPAERDHPATQQRFVAQLAGA